MINAGGNRGRIHATSTAIGAPGLSGTHESISGRILRPRREAVHLRNALGRDTRFLGAALRAAPAEALVAFLLLALAISAFIPSLHFELNTASDQAAVETAASLISGVAAILFCGRFWHHLRLRDLLLASGLAVIGLSNLGAGLLLAGNLVLAGHSAAWIVLGGRLVGWLLIASPAVVHDRRLSRPTPATLRMLGGAVALLVCVATPIVALSAHVTSYGVLHSGPLGNPSAMLAGEVLLALLAGVAAVAFQREAVRTGNPPARLLALACAFAATAGLAACATPSFYASQVGIADILRLGWLVALFACVCIQWSLDERQAPAHALAHERRRMAADVHDLIMQDLSLALANARTLVDDPTHGGPANTIVTAGERALAGARDVLNTLTERDDAQPIIEAVEAGVRAAARHTALTFDADATATVAQADDPTRQALVHIGREAVTNAVKHAGARKIAVAIAREDEWRLTVRDDGRGFDPRSGARDIDPTLGSGFGLNSMRDQAEALGGRLLVRSDERGTTVEALLP
ncbi:MAG TPA: ATP-binding protein [Solirubrobacteraceae bacterium]|jgi:signal transduction histidine kinase